MAPELAAKNPEAKGAENFYFWYDPKFLSKVQLDAILSSFDQYSVRDNGEIFEANVIGKLEDIKRVAKVKGVVIAGSADREGQMVLASGNPALTSDKYSRSVSYHNYRNNFARTIRVGIQDELADSSARSGCMINHDHEAFEFASFEYSNTNYPNGIKQCNVSADCPSKCSCENSLCLIKDLSIFSEGLHTEQVMSRISSSMNGVHKHASDVTFLVLNNDEDLKFNLHSGSLFADRNVNLINQSVGDYGVASGNDRVMDWFARYRNMTIIKAAANLSTMDNGEADCEALNAICVGGTDSKSTYGSDYAFQDDEMYEESNWKNPRFSSYHTDQNKRGLVKEVEVPDVVAEAFATHVIARGGNNTEWTYKSGVSFAAPVVTGLVALHWEACGGVQSPVMTRATLRTASYLSHNLDPNSPAYPVPSLYGDSKAGVGIIDAKGLSRFCGPPRPPGPGNADIDTYVEEGIIDPRDDSSWQHVPRWANSDGITDISSTSGRSPQKQELVGPGHVWKPTLSVGRAKRVRYSFSFYSCIESTAGEYNTGPTRPQIEPAVDFDLALCVDGEDNCIHFSETMDDTDEGFDVSLPDEYWEKDLTVWLIKPPGNSVVACSGPQNGFEPWASAAIIWR